MSASTIGAQQGGALVRGRTANRPFRQEWRPEKLCVIEPESLGDSVLCVHGAIREIERARGCGAYVFVDSALNAYVVSEERPAAADWVKTRFAWLVGYYRTQRCAGASVPLLRPTIEGILEDMQDHLLDLARLPS